MSLFALFSTLVLALFVLAVVVREKNHQVALLANSNLDFDLGWIRNLTRTQKRIKYGATMRVASGQGQEGVDCPQTQSCVGLLERSRPSLRHRASKSTNDARLSAWRPPVNPFNHSLDKDSSVKLSAPATPSSTSPVAQPSLVPEMEDPNLLLTALASQERRVMELREELKKAEDDLSRLKERWTAHEVIRKRDDLLAGSTPLRSMTTPAGPALGSDGLLVLEDRPRTFGERRQTMQARARPTQRRFEGGKHARALSLLSVNYTPGQETLSRYPPKALPDVQENPDTPEKENSKPSPTHVRTAESLGRREDFMNTGKQLVGDLKDGLWTFIEDLKQATVGDEALGEARARQAFGTPVRAATLSRTDSPAFLRQRDHLNKPPRSSRKRPPSLEVRGFELEVCKEPRPIRDEKMLDEDWENWDSPPPKTGSIFDETARSTPRTSTR